MSRNLLRTDCYFCGAAVVLTETPRAITEQDAGYYYDEYRGMVVGNAICVSCQAKYLGWVVDSPWFAHQHKIVGRVGSDDTGKLVPFDLSFRSTFNDEPGAQDLPPPTWGVSNHCDGAMWQAAGKSREGAIAFGRKVYADDGTKGFFVAEFEPWEPGDLFDVPSIAQEWKRAYAWESNHDGPRKAPEFPEVSFRTQ